MLLTPRYGEDPLISIEVRDPGPHPIVSQHRRLEAQLAELSDDEWHSPSRCHGWTVRDVVTHLASANSFWALSIQAGQAGEPTRFMAGFDPVATPAEMAAKDQCSPQEALEQLVVTGQALADAIDRLQPNDWDLLAEAPPGHLPIWLVADHALWDCWVHERDILLPLDRAVVVDATEVRTCLHYAATLGRAFALASGRNEQGAIVIEASDPDDHVVVEVDAVTVRVHAGPGPDGVAAVQGDAVALLEMLSMRDTAHPVPAELGWLTDGLARVFDQAPG